MPDSTRRLKVKRYKVTNVDYLYFSAYRLRVEIADATGMDRRVFVYRRDPASPYTDEATDTFFAVASPVDMAEYPPEEPDPNKSYPFFRKHFVELDVRAVSLALLAEQIIVHELNVLVHALNKLEDLDLAEEFWIGPFPGDVVEDGDSLSDSLSLS